VVTFLNGATAMACLAIATFFARFWRESDDPLFLYWTFAFGVFALNYSVLAIVPLAEGQQIYVFALRLIGFVAIFAGIAVKNRQLARHVRSRRSDRK